jgi:hypothetical protein
MRKFAMVCLVFLSAIGFTSAVVVAAEQGTAEAAGSKWLTVRVHTEEGQDADVQLPLSLQELVKRVVDVDRLSQLTEGKAKAPLAALTKILGELQAAPDQEILTVEAEKATVKIATETRKQAENTKPAVALKISVKPLQEKGERVNVTVPLGIVEMIARCVKETPISEADFEAMGVGPEKTGLHLAILVQQLPQVIASIRSAGAVDLVSVKDSRQEVRVWIE